MFRQQQIGGQISHFQAEIKGADENQNVIICLNRSVWMFCRRLGECPWGIVTVFMLLQEIGDIVQLVKAVHLPVTLQGGITCRLFLLDEVGHVSTDKARWAASLFLFCW